MFPTGAFNPMPMGFQYPGQQQQQPSIYQSQFGGFAPQVPPPFQQAPLRGQSVPASKRQYPPPSGAYVPTSSRRHDQYPPSQHHEYRHHKSKSKKHSKPRSISPKGAADESLYSDKEKDNRSRSHSSVLESTTKQEESNNNDQEHQSQTLDSASGEISQGGTNITDEPDKSNEKRRSRSKKKKHHRPEYYTDNNNPQYQQLLPTSLYGEISSQARQPFYGGYNQVYDESNRRNDVYHKKNTRLPRFSQDIQQHEDDRQKQYQYPAYTQPVFNAVPPAFNPYQPGFYPPPPPAHPYNIPPRWGNINGIPGQAEQEIQRLRSHIHTLEGQLNKLQKKLHKSTLNPNDENTRTHQHSKHEEISSPRQTPVIVELNNTIPETNQETPSKKKHRHRKGKSHDTQQGQNLVEQLGENTQDQNISNQQQVDSHEHSHSDANQILETENKSAPKPSREETAAQLAHAAAAHVNARQQVPPPPPVQQQQQGPLPSQNQQFRAQPIRFPATGNVHYPNEPYQQRSFPNANYNQSNNNEILDPIEEQRNRRSADKILDAFERVYMNKTSTTPMKVKYIPEEITNSSHHQHRNTNNNNNNNNNRDRSRTQSSSSSSSSSSWSDSD